MEEPITQTPQEPVVETVTALSGFEEGTVLDNGEIIQGTYDESGNLVGWHKEAPAQEEQV